MYNLHNKIIAAANELPDDTKEEMELKTKFYNLAEDVRELTWRFEEAQRKINKKNKKGVCDEH